ncbi:MAG: glycosyltransferase [Actinomycetota bacterium]|nr:glycosyltransferase [Actinomycetota bacterium]
MIERVAYLALHTSPLLQPGIGNAGGMNVYVDELACTMAGRGVEAVVFTRRTDPDQPSTIEVRNGYRVVHVDAGPPEPLPTSELMPHVGEFGEGVVAETRNAGFDLVHSHYWLSGWAGVLIKEAHGLPLANSFHTLGRVKDVARRRDEAPSSVARLRAEDGVITGSDCIIASTPYEFDDLIEHYGASPERLCISQPGIDHSLFTPGDRSEARARIGVGDRPLILCVGRIQAHKGFDVAIDMLSLLPDSVGNGPEPPLLMIVGGPSGPDGLQEIDNLRSRAAAKGVAERVRFVSPQPHGSLVDYYRAADVLVMPSRSESFGLVAAEAQASGLPVVAARVGGLPYVVGASTSGLLVDDHDPHSFAAATTAILDHPTFRSNLSSGAVEFAARFSWEGTADRLLDLYDGIVRGTRSARKLS